MSRYFQKQRRDKKEGRQALRRMSRYDHYAAQLVARPEPVKQWNSIISKLNYALALEVMTP